MLLSQKSPKLPPSKAETGLRSCGAINIRNNEWHSIMFAFPSGGNRIYTEVLYVSLCL